MDGRKDWRERAKLVFYFPCFYQVCSRWHSGKEFACEYRRHKRCGFDPWVGKISRRRKWQSSPVLLLGKFHGQRSLAGHSPWGCKESDTTEGLTLSFTIYMHYIYVHTHIYILFFIFFSIMLLWDSECSFLFYIHSRTLLFTYFIYCSVYLSKPNL